MNATIPRDNSATHKIFEDRRHEQWRIEHDAAREAKAYAKNRHHVLKERKILDGQALMKSKAPRQAWHSTLPKEVRLAIIEAEQKDQDRQFFIDRARGISSDIAYRLQRGYLRTSTLIISGVSLPHRFEAGLRSVSYNGNVYKTLARWPSLVHKASRLRTSKGNTSLETKGIKLFALDEPYIEGNREMLSFIRLDTDRVWQSPEHAAMAFAAVTDEQGVACPPNLLVGVVDEHGHYRRPHAIWILPYGSAVLNMPDAEGFREAPLKLFKSVYYGLVHAYLELNADPNAPSTTQQVKNPLSPEMTTVVLNDEIFVDLAQHAESLDLTKSKEHLARMAAALQTDAPLEISNGVFSAFRKAAIRAMSNWHFGGDRAFHKAVAERRIGAIADRVHAHLESLDLGDCGKSMTADEISRLASKVADYAAANWDAAKIDNRNIRRGHLMHEVEGKTTRESQQIAAGYATGCVVRSTDEKIADAVDLMMVDGYEVTKKGLARVSGLALGTVKSRWSMVEQIVAGGSIRCYDKKVGGNTSITEQNQSETVGVEGEEMGVVESVFEQEADMSRLFAKARVQAKRQETAVECDDDVTLGADTVEGFGRTGEALSGDPVKVSAFVSMLADDENAKPERRETHDEMLDRIKPRFKRANFSAKIAARSEQETPEERRKRMCPWLQSSETKTADSIRDEQMRRERLTQARRRG
jgi:hypothetical protein